MATFLLLSKNRAWNSELPTSLERTNDMVDASPVDYCWWWPRNGVVGDWKNTYVWCKSVLCLMVQHCCLLLVVVIVLSQVGTTALIYLLDHHHQAAQMLHPAAAWPPPPPTTTTGCSDAAACRWWWLWCRGGGGGGGCGDRGVGDQVLLLPAIRSNFCAPCLPTLLTTWYQV